MAADVDVIVEGLTTLIKKNMIARTNAVSNVLTSNIVYVENTFHYEPDQEAVLIDMGYNQEGYSATSHYQQYEYVRIKQVVDTHKVILYNNTVGNWYVTDQTSFQKIIGHSPLYEEHVYYGDREVIPSEEMAITVEPNSLANEWVYLMGGLSNEYRLDITIYGKDIHTENGLIILNKYSAAVYKLFMQSLHTDINNYETPILANVVAGTNTVIIADTPDNRENITLSATLTDDECYEIQDNQLIEIDMFISNIQYATPMAGQMTLTVYRQNPTNVPIGLSNNIQFNYTLPEYAVFRKHGRYMYDSRIDGITYGKVQKGSAFLRAASLAWFGKEVEEYSFPQKSKGTMYFPEVP